ncbi:hypothetical protein Y032_0033g2680 [Ancylostoma ceylanicum]|uniref:RNA-directed DNA polymerase n=1 Tax=Ancylostoma ceylanicum TaxID=53326 RepID=A0A016UNN4_9BILA|nr:hypothetical protein Y032_0033g2680 [Ancylostoma ceylanicum]
MDEDSRPLLTINTHRGLYRLNRLPFGVKPAPGIFQQYIDALIAGLDGTAAYLDDIIVTGRTVDEHNARLNAVFQRIHDYGFHVRLEKCAFLQTEINLGFVINAEGRRPDPKKIEAIHKMPHPKDVSQLRAFLGLVNFFGTFGKDLHNFRAPLDALTKKDAVYTWTPECQSSFDRIKATLKSDLLLTHFNPVLDSRPLLTINTHRGLYRLNRLPFGVKPAPCIFQQYIDALIAGLHGTAAYLDNIIVTGRTTDEHNTRLNAVFQRIHDYGFRVRLEKCAFLQTEINYLGFVINADGRRPDPKKIEAIHKMPHSKDVSQLRAFFSLVNFYGKFVKDLHNLRAPLDALTKKDAVYT